MLTARSIPSLRAMQGGLYFHCAVWQIIRRANCTDRRGEKESFSQLSTMYTKFQSLREESLTNFNKLRESLSLIVNFHFANKLQAANLRL